MNLRVRRVTWESDMMAVGVDLDTLDSGIDAVVMARSVCSYVLDPADGRVAVVWAESSSKIDLADASVRLTSGLAPRFHFG
jgi:hypothetical protein